AKDIIEYMPIFNSSHGTELSVRIGINSGSVTAGVIGTQKISYDLWGDAVNTASRMESSGIPGKIHISESAYILLKDKYSFEERGEIEIKGKGKMKTYLGI
ncbi:MAG TPA: adenylate/guanylate cyclase domain-containing protein, partial [Leptospiraceae bacterium]|nr:adenylate/guanylate cyclase domain-containing protein [Leptospiraceae bacterium]